MNKNEIYQGKVLRYGTNGEGVIQVEGTTAFVPYCIPEEEVTFKVLSVKGGVAYGKVESILSPSPKRTIPQCQVANKCGGCQLQHLIYPEQLAFKRESVQNTLQKLGNLTVELLPTVPGESYRYRNKLALPIGVDAQGNNVVGFYAERSHRIVPITDCAIQSAWCKKVIEGVYALFAAGNHGYNEQTKKGELRQIVVRELNGKFIVVLVATKKVDCSPLMSYLEELGEYTLLVNINRNTTNALFGEQFILVHGQGSFEAEEGGIFYSAGAKTFVQVNDGVRNVLYRDVVAHAKKENTVALDLYSGGGLLTAMLAKACGSAYGIEIVPEATACANELAKRNGLEHVMHNICGKVEEKLAEVMQKTEGKERVIVCDPPRKGMERSVISAILNSGAERVVLVSCNPSTLARDLGLLCGSLREEGNQIVKADGQGTAGYYKIEQIRCYDMFAQTKHVETLVLLSKK